MAEREPVPVASSVCCQARRARSHMRTTAWRVCGGDPERDRCFWCSGCAVAPSGDRRHPRPAASRLHVSVPGYRCLGCDASWRQRAQPSMATHAHAVGVGWHGSRRCGESAALSPGRRAPGSRAGQVGQERREDTGRHMWSRRMCPRRDRANVPTGFRRRRECSSDAPCWPI